MAIAAVVAVAIRLVGGHAFPDYDATFALIWGRDLAHGHEPNYHLAYRPAGHPLLTLFTLVVSPLGRTAAADAVRWLALLGAGWFVVAALRAGQAAFGLTAGVVAAVVLATRTATLGFPLLSFLDPLAAGFVLYALALELQRPRRGGVVLVLLALAGVVRPEAWLLAAAYWLWLLRGSRARALRLAPLAALGPLAWVAWDLATSQTFLGSVRPDPNAPVTSTYGRGVSHVPTALVHFLGGYLRPPEAIAAAIGILIALVRRDRRATLPLTLLVLNVLAFALVATGRGPLEQRYLLVAITILVLFAAYAITQLPRTRAGAPSRSRTGARVAAAVLAVACVAYAPVDVSRIVRLHDRVRVANALDSELRDTITAQRARCGLRGHVHLADIRLRPFIAYWGAIPLERIGTEPGGTGSLEPRDSAAQELVSSSLPAHTARTPIPTTEHVPVLASSRGWLLTGRCGARQ